MLIQFCLPNIFGSGAAFCLRKIAMQQTFPKKTAPDSILPRLWQALDALAICRGDYDLRPASLAVLRALISFLPSDAQGAQLLVWPSNHTLCHRACGMDERTLRRHLARLCDIGLVRRNTSANGKRFALRVRKTVVAAFGFDLAPLLHRAAEIANAAEEQAALQAEAHSTRAQILVLLHRANTTEPSYLAPDQDAEIRKLLRRHPDLSTLTALRDELAAMTKDADLPPDALPPNLTASRSQNDLHQQKTDKDSFDSEKDGAESEKAAGEDLPHAHRITFADCLHATRESQTFASDPIRTWADLTRLADTLAPMVGIGAEVANHARRVMGPIPAAVTILCLVQRGESIRRPGAYLRKLACLAESGMYSLRSLVQAAQHAKPPGGQDRAG